MSFDFRESTALFGGSFHPPHLGHHQAIEGLFTLPGVKKVIILPSFGTPLKKVTVTFEHRFEMAKLAFSNIPNTEISDFESKNQIQFTWQLLEKIIPQVKNPVFVIGADQFENLYQWSHFPEFLKLCDWIILLRKPIQLDSLKPTIQKMVRDQMMKPTIHEHEFMVFGKKLKFVETNAKEINSTLLREKLAIHGWDHIDSFISNPVKEYIVRNNIYGK